MYNQDVIDRLNNLTNLYALKNANVKVISKKNQFGDVVKLFAQINSENIIQRITYKASGCTTFMALCSYFCEIVEGKTVEKALKINEKDLEKFSKLEENKTHVYKIILDTFALLIKKYKTGVEKGKIIPCEPLKEIEQVKNTKKSTKKIVNINKMIDINENYLINTPTKKPRKTKKEKNIENISQPKSVVVEEVVATKPESVVIVAQPKITRKKTTKIVKDIPNNQITTTTIEIVTTDHSDALQNAENIEKINENKKKALEHSKILEKSTRIVQIQSDKEKQKDQANNMKLSHINALNDKIKNKETNEKMKTNSDNLNNLLNKFKMSNTNRSTSSTSAVQTKTIETVEVSKGVEEKKITKKEKKENKKDKKQIKDKNTDKEPKKKSLFSWFKK